MIIKSVHGERTLVFREYDGEYVVVACGDGDVHARRRVYLYTDGPAIAALFRDIAEHWRGWDGEKDFESVEGDFSLEATADHLGHIALRVSLRHHDPRDAWSVALPIWLEAGSLDDIAGAMERYFASSARGEGPRGDPGKLQR